MIIERIMSYRARLPVLGGQYAWSEGKAVSEFDTTILRVDTDEGLTGWGEVCPLGPVYLPAYAGGVGAGFAELAPRLLGQDPREIAHINQVMDHSLKGHSYVKSPFDIACWDILGKATQLPVSVLLGGRFGTDFPVYRSISQDTPERMAADIAAHRAEGIRAWQLKVGGVSESEDIARIHAAVDVAPGDLIVADANTGWLSYQARRVANAMRGLDVVIEQPCTTYEECLSVRRSTSLPIVLDESIDSIRSLVRAYEDSAMDVVNVKIGKFGGLTKAKLVRDLCIQLGIAMTIEDMPGGDITGATILHLAHSTPERYRFSVTSSYLKVSVSIAEGGPKVTDGRTESNRLPGLGVEPRLDVLGEPVMKFVL